MDIKGKYHRFISIILQICKLLILKKFPFSLETAVIYFSYNNKGYEDAYESLSIFWHPLKNKWLIFLYSTYLIANIYLIKAKMLRFLLPALTFLRVFKDYPLFESTVVAVIVGFYIYYKIFVVKKVQFHCKESSQFSKLLKRRMPILTESFKPTL